jgi:hypothetical protein
MKAYQLIYSSSAGKKMLKSDLYMILRKARMNNESKNITGLLVYSDMSFLQILEGEKEVVTQLFETISKDNRHADIKILHEGNVDQRIFSSWAMAYSAPSSKELATWAGLHSTTSVPETLNRLMSEPKRISNVLLNALSNPSLALSV